MHTPIWAGHDARGYALAYALAAWSAYSIRRAAKYYELHAYCYYASILLEGHDFRIFYYFVINVFDSQLTMAQCHWIIGENQVAYCRHVLSPAPAAATQHRNAHGSPPTPKMSYLLHVVLDRSLRDIGAQQKYPVHAQRLSPRHSRLIDNISGLASRFYLSKCRLTYMDYIIYYGIDEIIINFIILLWRLFNCRRPSAYKNAGSRHSL